MKRHLCSLIISALFSSTVCAEPPQSHCLELTEQAIEICVNLEEQLIECSVSPVGEFVESCEVALTYNVESNYEGESYVKTFVECAAATAITRTNQSTEIIEDAREDHIALFDDSDVEQSMEFYFSYGLSARVAKSELNLAECYIVEASIW